MLLLHDSLFKHVTDGILKREKITVKKVWAPGLNDAFNFVSAFSSNPKVVIIHSGTNDLGNYSNENIVELVNNIHEILSIRGIKMVYSEIVPRMDELDFNAQVVNALVYKSIANNTGLPFQRMSVFIAKVLATINYTWKMEFI